MSTEYTIETNRSKSAAVATLATVFGQLNGINEDVFTVFDPDPAAEVFSEILALAAEREADEAAFCTMLHNALVKILPIVSEAQDTCRELRRLARKQINTAGVVDHAVEYDEQSYRARFAILSALKEALLHASHACTPSTGGPLTQQRQQRLIAKVGASIATAIYHANLGAY